MVSIKTALASFAILLTGISDAVADEASQDVWTECRETNSCSITYDHLATQDTDPFLFLGKVMDHEHPRWRRYRKAIRRHADVRDCLLRSEENKEVPNLTLIDWQAMGSGEVIEVCLFRIFSSLETPAAAMQWLEIQGMQNVVLNVRSEVVRQNWTTC